MRLENYFKPFRENIIGREQIVNSPFGEQTVGLTCNYFFKTVGALK